MQVIIWCIGREIGVIAIDTERRGEVYFLRLVDYVQDPLCGTIQGINAEELELCLEEMLKEVKYYEEGEDHATADIPYIPQPAGIYKDSVGDVKPPAGVMRRGNIRFVEGVAGIEVEDAVVDDDNSMMEMVIQAEEAAKKRAEASTAIAAAKKEKAAKDAERLEKQNQIAAARKKARQLAVHNQCPTSDDDDPEQEDH